MRLLFAVLCLTRIKPSPKRYGGKSRKKCCALAANLTVFSKLDWCHVNSRADSSESGIGALFIVSMRLRSARGRGEHTAKRNPGGHE